MISFPANSDIIVVHTRVSFACGINGMCRYCKIIINREPVDRAYFLFINRTEKQSRALWYDGQGFSLCTKRLSSGRFKYWPKPGESAASIISFFNAHILLASGNFTDAKCKDIWKNIK